MCLVLGVKMNHTTVKVGIKLMDYDYKCKYTNTIVINNTVKPDYFNQHKSSNFAPT